MKATLADRSFDIDLPQNEGGNQTVPRPAKLSSQAKVLAQ
jgi:hypothetical protein